MIDDVLYNEIKITNFIKIGTEYSRVVHYLQSSSFLAKTKQLLQLDDLDHSAVRREIMDESRYSCFYVKQVIINAYKDIFE